MCRRCRCRECISSRSRRRSLGLNLFLWSVNVPRYIAYPLIAGIAFGALSYWASRAVYIPSRYPEGDWERKEKLGAADAWIVTSDGVRIHGWYVNTGGSQLVTLFFHGNAGNITDRASHILEISKAGSSILMLDYRGYGKSGGRPTEKGLYSDARAAYEFVLKAGYRPEQVVIQGESLGTAVAVDLASQRPCAAVVLEAPFTSAKDVAGSVLPVIGPLLIWSFDSRSKVGRIRAPMLFIQGDHDEVIPLRLGQALFAVAPEPKSFWVVPGAGHNDIVETAGGAYSQRLRSLYEGLRKN
jgi:uncharacterized protein